MEMLKKTNCDLMKLQKQANRMKNIILFFTLVATLASCRSESNEVSGSSETETTSQSTSTLVKMNVINSQNVVQKDIVIMMFKTKVSSGSNLPTIEKEAVSDANGLAKIDLSDYISSNIAQIYFFEAFKKVGNNYVWVSKTHPEIEIKKNSQVTTSIIIN